LAGTPKGQIEKQVLAWWLYGRTAVARRWLAENLRMGHETRVYQSINIVISCGYHWTAPACLFRLSSQPKYPRLPMAQKPLHPLDQIGLGRLDDQVKMIGHQAVGAFIFDAVHFSLADSFTVL